MAACLDSSSPLTEVDEPPRTGLTSSSKSKVGNVCSKTSYDSIRSLQSLGGAEAGSNDPNLRDVIGTEEGGADPSPDV